LCPFFLLRRRLIRFIFNHDLCWCDKSIPMLRALTDSKYCCDEHRDYAKIKAFQGNSTAERSAATASPLYVDAGALEVSWLDVNGKMRVTRTRVVNISEDGIAFHLPEAIIAAVGPLSIGAI